MIAIKALIYIVGVPGVVVGILQLLPRLSVVPQDSLDDRNPFLAPFVISNDGYIALYKLSVACFPHYLDFRDLDGTGPPLIVTVTPGSHEEAEIGVSSPNMFAEKLLPGSKMSFPCKMILPSGFPTRLSIVRGDITFSVMYRVLGIPITRHHVNHFSLARDTSGHFSWLEEPLE